MPKGVVIEGFTGWIGTSWAVHKEHGGIGFKDIYGFNLALQGKQGWNLLKNPTALVSKIFKARYYPKADFLAHGGKECLF